MLVKKKPVLRVKKKHPHPGSWVKARAKRFYMVKDISIASKTSRLAPSYSYPSPSCEPISNIPKKWQFLAKKMTILLSCVLTPRKRQGAALLYMKLQ